MGETVPRHSERPAKGDSKLTGPESNGAGLGLATMESAIPPGRAARRRLPRSSHAVVPNWAERRDPVAILKEAEAGRKTELLPIRYDRMSLNAFTFYRGAASIMAADLGQEPHSDLWVQACGDAHLLNFGVFATPERRMVFDINDFDETLRAPFEWDVKRLAASIAVAGRYRQFNQATTDGALRGMLRAYRTRMASFAAMRLIDVWYSRIGADSVDEVTRNVALDALARRRLAAGLTKARSKDHLRAFAKLTEIVDNRRRIREDPPLLYRVEGDIALLQPAWESYLDTLHPDTRELLERYTMVDFAGKVVGVGSVGTRCWIGLLESDRPGDALFLQVKQAGAAVFEAYLGESEITHHGQRVVHGQQKLQSTSDMFLGWTRGPVEGIDYYVRQLWDAKGAIDLDRTRPLGFLAYADLCGQALARAHARTGEATEISAYLGGGTTFDRALVKFAYAYADQNELDHALLVNAIANGRISKPLPD